MNTARIAGALVLFIAGLSMTGWVLDVPLLRHWHPDAPSMKVVSCVNFFLVAAILFVLDHARWRNLDVHWPLSTVLLTLQFDVAFDFAIGGGLWHAVYSEQDLLVKTIAAGQPSWGTVAGHTLVCLVGFFWEKAARALRKKAIIGIGVIGAIALLGYALGSPALYYYWPDHSTGMSLPVGLSFVLTAWALWGLSAEQDRGH